MTVFHGKLKQKHQRYSLVLLLLCCWLLPLVHQTMAQTATSPFPQMPAVATYHLKKSPDARHYSRREKKAFSPLVIKQLQEVHNGVAYTAFYFEMGEQTVEDKAGARSPLFCIRREGDTLIMAAVVSELEKMAPLLKTHDNNFESVFLRFDTALGKRWKSIYRIDGPNLYAFTAQLEEYQGGVDKVYLYRLQMDAPGGCDCDWLRQLIISPEKGIIGLAAEGMAGGRCVYELDKAPAGRKP